MGLEIKRGFTSKYKKVIVASFAVFALVAQPFYGVISMQSAGAASAYTDYALSNAELANWSKDRTLPSGGYSSLATYAGRSDVLELRVDTTNASPTSGFYRTEGIQRQIGGTATSLKADIYISSDLASKDVRAGLWAVGNNAANAVASYPIIEFAAGTPAGGHTGWRTYNTVTGAWNNVSGQYTTDAWNTLEISLDTTSNQFVYKANGSSVGQASANSSTRIGMAIFNNFNPAGTSPNYDVRWNNFAVGTWVPDTPTLSAPATGSVYKTSQLPIAQSWSAVPGATGYIYESFTVNPETNPGATPTFAQTRTTNSRSIGVTADEGNYWWRVKAVGPNNTSSAWSSIRTFAVDNTAPVVAITDPTNDDVVNGVVTVTGTITDANPMNSYFRITGPNGYATTSLFTDGRTTHNFSWNTAALTDGEYTILFEARDKAQNKTSVSVKSIKVGVDNTSPTATFTHSNNNDATLVNTDVTSTLTASEPIQTPAGWTKVDDDTFTKVSTANNKGNMTITDLAGNSRSVFFEVKRIDKTDPVFNIINGSFFKTISVDVTTTEDNISKIEVDGPSSAIYTGAKPNYTVTVTGEGSHTVTAYDKAGNSSTVNFIIDTIAPVLTIDTVIKNIDGSYIISGKSNDTAPVTVMLNGTSYGSPVDPVTKIWSIETTVIPAGIYTIDATSIDAAGNPSELYQRPLVVTSTTPSGTANNNTGNEAPGDTTDTGSSDIESLAETDEQTVTSPQLAQLFIPGSATVLGAQDQDDDSNANGGTPLETVDEDVLGTSAEPKAASTSELGFMGLAWYWWLVILAALIGLWWFIAARRRQGASE